MGRNHGRNGQQSNSQKVAATEAVAVTVSGEEVSADSIIASVNGWEEMAEQLASIPREAMVAVFGGTEQPETPKIPKHRQCPVCHNGYGGKGIPKWWRRIHSTLVKRAYTCDQCGTNWTADIRTQSVVTKIEYKEGTVNHEELNIDHEESIGG